MTLAEKLRPQSLDEVVGQEKVVAELREAIVQKQPRSFLLWGPPGCGKTTLARIYAKAFGLSFAFISAAKDNIGDVKKIVEDFQSKPLFFPVIILVDELHRFNKLQQDYFLPFVEDGTVILVGVTTENPSFAINAALLSRLRVLVLESLKEQELYLLLDRYITKTKKEKNEDEKKTLVALAKGDGRYLLNMLDGGGLYEKAAYYDKKGDQHYNLISALHKSVRGSDPEAALYWLARMFKGGEDPLYIARRLIRMASEDVGLADPEALKIAVAAYEAYERLGSPEGELAIAEALVYLTLAPKSNALYAAFGKAQQLAVKSNHLSPPKIILNAPTSLMEGLGYGEGYIYDHDTEKGFSGQNYFPDSMEREEFYFPKEMGFERELKKRKEYFSKLRSKHK